MNNVVANADSDPARKDGVVVSESNDRLDQPASEQDRSEPATAGPNALGRRIRGKPVLVAGAIISVVVAPLVVLWGGGYFSAKQAREEPPLDPKVMFQQDIAFAKKTKDKRFYISDYEVTDEMISSISELDFIETLILDQGRITDEGIKAIASLPKLDHLRLRLSPVSDTGFGYLSKCKSLTYLNLPHAICTADGISQLTAIPRLRQLRLGSSNLGNEVTREIAKIESLRGLHLISIPVTDEGLKTLAAMPQLESLYLDDTGITEAGWDWLFDEYPYLHIHVNQIHHDRDPKAHPHHD